MNRLFVAAVSVLIVVGGLQTVAARPRSVGGWVEQAASDHPNALWHVVHGLCLRDLQATGNPAPCALVDVAGGFAVVKNIQHRNHYLLVPTTRLTGIESPELLAPGSPNYWRAAWGLRARMQANFGRVVPREDIGMAVNSITGRTQNQLHIHVDCLKPSVRDLLARRSGRIGARWTILAIGPNGRRYRVRWLAGDDLGNRDPFKILARTDPVARADMGLETIAVAGASRPDGQPGFVMLADRRSADGLDPAAGEELLDHKCAVMAGAD